MHTHSIFTVLSASLIAALTSQLGSAHELAARQSSTGILINPPGQPALPAPPQAQPAIANAGNGGLDLTNIQGDILVGMKKRKELFFFFKINARSVAKFKSLLASQIHPLITNTAQLLSVSTQPQVLLNIAFSQQGLTTLGINGTDPLNDEVFSRGQAADNGTLGDPGVKNWVRGFVDTKNLHGVFLLASDSVVNVNLQLAKIQLILGASITEVHRLQGAARPGSEEGHEHFGFLDGISQPAVQGFTTSPNPGQAVIPAGIILLGENGDPVQRPDWAKDGSFLAFRQLKQLVPEFNKFTTDNPIKIQNLTAKQGSDLMGARMVGRWKSGAPIELSPLFDDPALGADANRNNNFDFSLASDESRCPFSAHIRKTNPRSDFTSRGIDFTNRHVMRGGIPYGPEVTVAETALNKTAIERGLAFISYQASIANGFQFLQQSWANNPNFFPHPNVPVPGFDPIIGANKGLPRNVSGLDAANQARVITLKTDFIESRGGEYFFSPSLSAILSTLAV